MISPLLAALLMSASPDIVENLNQPIPLELAFVDEASRPVKLAQFFHRGRPVVITPVYYGCTVLCGRVLRGVVETLGATGLQRGLDFDVLTYSIDPQEKAGLARSKREELLPGAGEPGWQFLTGDEANIRALSEALGFRYQYDAQLKRYVHAAGFMVLTPEGKVSRYLYGVRFDPRDVRLALVEAAGGRVGTSFDRFILRCTRYDPVAQKYRPWLWGLIRGGGSLVFLALGLTLFVYWRRELRFGSGRRPSSRLR